MDKNCLIILFFYILFPLILKAQSGLYYFEKYSVQEGLSQSTIYSIYQDSRGFLWFGTSDGLNRYDGYKFHVYRHNPYDSLSLSSNRIYSIQEDEQGNLWLGTNGGGLNKFFREKEKFISYQHNPNIKTSLSSNKILKIYFDGNGILWVGTEGGGLNKFDRNKEIFTRYLHNPEIKTSLSDNVVRAIYEDKSRDLWIGTANGLNKFVKGKEEFSVFKSNNTNPSGISDNEILSIYEDSYNQLWIGTGNGGLNVYNSKRQEFQHFMFNSKDPYSINSNRIFAIEEDKSGTLWIGSMGGGLNRFNRDTKRFDYFTSNSDDPTSLSNNNIFSVYCDKSGVLWIGTYNGGLNKLDQSKQRFKHFLSSPENPDGLSSNAIYSFYEDIDGYIWIGTGSGLNRYDRTTGKFSKYVHNPYDKNSLSNNEIIVVYGDKSSDLWIGTYGGGMDRYDKGSNSFFHYKNDAKNVNCLSSNRVFTIYQDTDGYIWIGTDGGGLNCFDKKKNEFINFKNNFNDTTGLNSDKIYTIYEDKFATLWIGTDGGGLNKYDKEKSRFYHFLHNPKDTESISNNSVFSIYEDNSGNLWLGTYGGGLNKFDRKKSKFKNYRKSEGLPNEVVYGILEDGEGNLWLSTNKGLVVFDPHTENFRSYDVRDGIQSNEFNQGAYLKTKDGSMLFGGINGFNFFQPDSLKKNSTIPNVVITDFQLFNKSISVYGINSESRKILSSSISETHELNLTYEDNVISFEFSALDYQTPSKNHYAYYMEGFDKEWNYTDANRRFVTYTNLDPGEYTFKVKGSNNDGVWNEAGTSLKIIINPPWWSTWWAYSLYGVVLLLILLFMRQYDLRRQRLRHQLELEHEHSKKLEEIDQMKSRFFTNISHEFRTPLTLILGPAEKIISEMKDTDTGRKAGLIKRNANRLLDLINQLLDLSKLEAGKLKLEASLSNLSSFVKGIAISFESLAEKKDITLDIQIEKQYIEAYFDKDKMQKILTNILANAFKFTMEGGRVELNLTVSNYNSVIISVRDTGIGISAQDVPKIFDRFYQSDSSSTRESWGTGVGLALTKELVELHGGEIYVNSKEGEGTEVVVEFPLGREHLKEGEIVQSDEKVIEEKEIPVSDFIPDKIDELDSENVKFNKNLVLIVEDNRDVREFIKDSLQSEFDTIEALNGEQGLKRAEKYIPDLIVSDIMMPKMDGYEMMQKIKQDEKTSHIPVILLTAKSDKDSKLEGLGLGADDYLTKPFDAKELQARIKNLIETRRLLQQKFSDETFKQKIKGKPGLNPLDEKFINKILEVIEVHLSEDEFSIEEISEEAGMSRAQIYRKLKALTGKSPSLFLRNIRLNKAKEMIHRKELSISEISYQVGFSSPAYFSRCFKEEFGYAPSELNN